jgi:hypothetical protein
MQMTVAAGKWATKIDLGSAIWESCVLANVVTAEFAPGIAQPVAVLPCDAMSVRLDESAEAVVMINLTVARQG